VAPPRTRTSTRALLGGIFVAGWIGVSLGWVGRGRVQGEAASSLESSTMELRFHDRYNLRDGDYFQDYNYLKEAEASLIAAEEWTTASVEGLSCSEGCTWIVMDTGGNTTTTTSTDDDATLDFKFSESGQGKVFLTYELDSTTYSVRHAFAKSDSQKANARKMRDSKHCCRAASTSHLFF